jgi:TonB-dependent receptor
LYNPLSVPPFVTPDNPRLGKYLGYRENSGITSLSYGILTGLTYRFNARHQIQAQYIGSSGAEASAANLNGAWENTGLQYPVYNYVNQLKQSYRKFNTFNFQGEHQLIKKNWSPRVGYNLSASLSSQNEPDFRFTDVAMSRATRLQDPAGTGVVSDLYSFVSGSVHGLGPDGMILADPNGRKFRKLDEHNYNAKVDVTQPFNISGRQQLFKAGYNYLRRERDFTENVMGLPGSNLGGDNGQLDRVQGRLDELVSYGNIGLKDPGGYDDEGQPRVGGFLYQIRKSPNNYIGTYETQAFYGMIDAHINDRLRLTGGVRFESTDIRAKVDTSNVFNPLVNGPLANGSVNTGVSTARPNTGLKTSFKPYYSANLTYAYRSNMNFRLGYSTTLARPELRELTNIYEFDPFQFAVVVGNPDLKNQLTRSVDFRWEWFLQPGEVIAASVFGKQIESQLTKVFSYNPQGSKALAPEFPVVAYRNDPNRGQLVGVELEIRKNLGVLTPALRRLFVGANVMFASSSITKNAERVNASRAIDRNASDKSPLFEQAPYSINAYLDYDNPRTGTSLMTSFNMVGERLIQVQLDGTPDLYSRPAPMLDVVFSQRLMKRFTLKGFVKNILNPAFREVYSTPRTNGLYHGVRYIRHEFYRGTEYSLGLTYRLL